MDDIFNAMTRWVEWLQGKVVPAMVWLRASVGIETVIFGVVAAGGMLITLIGLLSVRRVNLLGEAAHLEGIREPGALDRLQTRLYQSGLRIKVREFLVVGVMIGLALGGLFIVLGFISIGVVFCLSGPFLYYQMLMNRRAKELRNFREEMPIAILDTRDYLVMKANDLRGAMLEMSERGPKSLRIDFDYAFRLMGGGAETEPIALREVARSREEPFFRQFFNALAEHHKGGDTAAVLTRVAQGQKTHNRLQAKTRAKQAGLRMVGLIYMFAPPLFAVFMSFAGGIGAREFYATPTGQLVQLFSVLAGVVSYEVSGRIARRGLYLDEVTSVRLETEHVPALVASDEFGLMPAEEPFVVEAGDMPPSPTPATTNSIPVYTNGKHPQSNGVAYADDGVIDDGFEEISVDDEEDDISVEELTAFQNLDFGRMVGDDADDEANTYSDPDAPFRRKPVDGVNAGTPDAVQKLSNNESWDMDEGDLEFKDEDGDGVSNESSTVANEDPIDIVRPATAAPDLPNQGENGNDTADARPIYTRKRNRGAGSGEER
jgi:Flp pilus assembly protein TadB